MNLMFCGGCGEITHQLRTGARRRKRAKIVLLAFCGLIVFHPNRNEACQWWRMIKPTLIQTVHTVYLIFKNVFLIFNFISFLHCNFYIFYSDKSELNCQFLAVILFLLFFNWVFGYTLFYTTCTYSVLTQESTGICMG